MAGYYRKTPQQKKSRSRGTPPTSGSSARLSSLKQRLGLNEQRPTRKDTAQQIQSLKERLGIVVTNKSGGIGTSNRFWNLTDRLGFPPEIALEIISREHFLKDRLEASSIAYPKTPIPEMEPSYRCHRELDIIMAMTLWFCGSLYAALVVATDMWIPFLWLLT